MEGARGHNSTRPGRAAELPQGPKATTVNFIEAIRTIEAFVRSASWPKKAKNAWKYVKEAAFNKDSNDALNASKDIQELKTQIKSLTDLVKGIAKQPKASISYADALRSKGGPSTANKPDARGVQAVPARRARELVIAPGTETPIQRHRTSLELVRDVNIAIEGSGEAVAAKRLLP